MVGGTYILTFLLHLLNIDLFLEHGLGRLLTLLGRVDLVIIRLLRLFILLHLRVGLVPLRDGGHQRLYIEQLAFAPVIQVNVWVLEVVLKLFCCVG